MPQTNNTKQAAWVAFGSLCSYSITLVSSMILSRYFNKADYGTYKQVMYVYHTLLTVFTLGLPRAFSYFLPRVPDEQARSLISKLTKLFFILGLVFSLVLFFFSPLIARWLNNPELGNALKLFAVVPALLLPTLGLDGIMATYKKTQFLAIYKTATSLLTLLCVALPVMVFNLGYMDAIKGFIVGSAIQCVLALILKNQPVRSFRKEKCGVTLKEIFQFSIPLMVASLWGILINSTDQFFISRYFGNEVFADFSNGAIEFPVATLLIGASTTVLTPLFSRQAKEGGDLSKTILPVWSNNFKKSCMILYPMLIFCIFEAKPIMTLLYGAQYANSGNYFIIKMMTNFVKIIPYAAILIAIGSVKVYSRVMMLVFLGLAPLEYVSTLVFPDNPYILVIIHTLLVMTQAFIYILYVKKFMKVKLSDIIPFQVIIKILCISAVCVGILLFFKKIVITQSVLFMLLIEMSLFGLLFIGLSKLFHIDYLQLIKPLLSNGKQKSN